MTNGKDEASTGDDVFRKASAEIEGRTDAAAEHKARPKPKRPAPGPHAKAELVNKATTPGAGTLSDPDQDELDAPTG